MREFEERFAPRATPKEPQKFTESDFPERRSRRSRPDSQAIPLSMDQRRPAKAKKPSRIGASLLPRPFRAKRNSEGTVPTPSPARFGSVNAKRSRREDARRANRRDRRLEVVAPLNAKPTQPIRDVRANRAVMPMSVPRTSESIAPSVKKGIVLPRPKTRSGWTVLYGTRLLVLGIGISVIAGTILSVWDPGSRTTAGTQTEQVEQTPAPADAQAALPQLELSQEILPLKTQLTTLADSYRGAEGNPNQITAGLMVVDLDTQSFVDINAANSFSAASTIKFPLLVAFFQDVDQGKIRLDQKLTMRKEIIATESGDMQYLPPGTQFSALDVATRMIVVSDNTATNMILELLGGPEAVNQRFQSWGLTNTGIRNILPDLPGLNTSSPRDMVTLLGLVNSGKLMSLRASDRMLSIMRDVQNNSLLPQGLGEGALIAHKTGDIGSMLGDVGIVDTPNGKRYLIAAMVKRPHNDDRAGDLIRQMSQLTYRHLNQAAAPSSPAPASSPSPSISPTPSNSMPASPTPTNDSQGSGLSRSRIAQP
jgi:beta-lactamase class A